MQLQILRCQNETKPARSMLLQAGLARDGGQSQLEHALQTFLKHAAVAHYISECLRDFPTRDPLSERASPCERDLRVDEKYQASAR